MKKPLTETPASTLAKRACTIDTPKMTALATPGVVKSTQRFLRMLETPALAPLPPSEELV